MATTYNYDHDWATPTRDKVRFLIGDHRGTNGSATGWLFSDNEIADVNALTGDDIKHTCRILLQCRLSREALAAGVSGTTDTTDRPQGVIAAIRGLDRTEWPGQSHAPDSTVTDMDTLDRDDLGYDSDNETTL